MKGNQPHPRSTLTAAISILISHFLLQSTMSPPDPKTKIRPQQSCLKCRERKVKVRRFRFSDYRFFFFLSLSISPLPG